MGFFKKILTLWVFLLSLFAFGEEITVNATGVGYSQPEAEENAYKNALVEALRRVSVRVGGTTFVKNGVLLTDLVTVRFGGAVECRKVKNFWVKTVKLGNLLGFEVKNLYRCEVNPRKLEGFGIEFVAPTEVKAYSTFRVYLSVKKPCYGYLYDIDSLGKVYLVFPRGDSDNLLTPGSVRVLELKAYPLPEVPLPQTETLIFVCSTERSPFFEKGFVNLASFGVKNVEECLKFGLCRSDKKEEELLQVLSHLKGWDFSVRSFEIY